MLLAISFWIVFILIDNHFFSQSINYMIKFLVQKFHEVSGHLNLFQIVELIYIVSFDYFDDIIQLINRDICLCLIKGQILL